MFDNLLMDDSIQAEKDVLGGGGSLLETGVYDFTIEMAYASKSAGGAAALNVHLKSDSGATLRKAIYVTNKKGENFYLGKDGQKAYLPGFLLATNLCLLTVKKELHQVTPEDKTIMLYDFDAKKELPTKAKVLVDLIGQRVTVSIVKEVVDKTAKQGDGSYAPTGETREQNEIDKFFHIDTGMTVAELRAKATTAEFKEQWAAKNTGVTRNKATGAKAGGAGKPQAAANKPAPKSLFED